MTLSSILWQPILKVNIGKNTWHGWPQLWGPWWSVWRVALSNWLQLPRTKSMNILHVYDISYFGVTWHDATWGVCLTLTLGVMKCLESRGRTPAHAPIPGSQNNGHYPQCPHALHHAESMVQRVHWCCSIEKWIKWGRSTRHPCAHLVNSYQYLVHVVYTAVASQCTSMVSHWKVNQDEGAVGHPPMCSPVLHHLPFSVRHLPLCCSLLLRTRLHGSKVKIFQMKVESSHIFHIFKILKVKSIQQTPSSPFQR